MRPTKTIETLAAQARAEHSSGVVDAGTWDHGWLEGVDAALSWVTGAGTTHEMHELLLRQAQAGVL